MMVLRKKKINRTFERVDEASKEVNKARENTSRIAG
jgi:hypothetical protein